MPRKVAPCGRAPLRDFASRGKHRKPRRSLGKYKSLSRGSGERARVPMFEWNEDDKKIDFSHNPFSMPQGGLEALETTRPAGSRRSSTTSPATAIELASGGIRNHQPEVDGQGVRDRRLRRETCVERFGGMYRAFHYGAPPHGGMAAGVDRIVMLLAGEQNLREVALFPMNQRAEDLLMGAPSPATREAIARAAHPAEPAGEVRGLAWMTAPLSSSVGSTRRIERRRNPGPRRTAVTPASPDGRRASRRRWPGRKRL